jgi:hypothetical protein
MEIFRLLLGRYVCEHSKALVILGMMVAKQTDAVQQTLIVFQM